jgi:rhodanese-related sulfurtransferase
MDLKELITQKSASIIDVRSPEEFMGGHVEGSVNIPLHDLNDRLDEIKQIGKPLVLCCASGNRSGMAANFLSQQGLECYNGGSWLDVNYYQSQMA